MEVTEAIKKRRSIRKLKSDPIDDEKVTRVLDAARWAPSWANTQCVRFIAVRDKEIKRQLADTIIPFVRPGGGSAPSPAAEAVDNAPVLIVICAELNRSGCMPGGEAVTDKGGYWFMFDAALATQNLVLEAYNLGLGTVIIGLFDASKAGEILEVPEGYCVVVMTPLGYPDEEPDTMPRKELSEIVSYEKFGG